MVLATINLYNNEVQLFEISGHASSNSKGNDLVCAGITAIVSGALNALTQLFANATEIKVFQNQIIIKVIKNTKNLQMVLNFMIIQLKTISIQYPNNFKIKEVL